MIIIEGRDEEDLLSISEKIEDICLEHGALDILVADTSKEQRKVLNIRSLIYEKDRRTI